ncbi:MAG: histone deacetylase [Deltaproteobacteria bacterium]|nr:histone deacetylase [Deltaproteobacteria bacterium]
MLKRENLKQAIDAISARDSEIGYTLNEMFVTGRIDVVPRSVDDTAQDHFDFVFDNEKVAVKKIIFFNEGSVAIEQRLLIKYGEMAKKEEILTLGKSVDYRRDAMLIQRAGLRLLVIHEIDCALERLRKREAAVAHRRDTEADDRIFIKIISFLNQIKQSDFEPKIVQADDPAVLYTGVVDTDRPACFVRFPYSLEALMQVAELDLEFFHIRFILKCLEKDRQIHLFACVVDQRIAGLVYLQLATDFFYKGLEVKYIATQRGQWIDAEGHMQPPYKGIGTFLMAGVWMLWKNRFSKVKEIFLDSEIAAGRFYESIGFHPRRLCEYVLGSPCGYLLNAIVIMADRSRSLNQAAIQEINNLIKKQVHWLLKKKSRKSQNSDREEVLHFLKICLFSTTQADFAKTVVKILLRKKSKIPEAEELIRFGAEKGRVRVKDSELPIGQPVLVVKDPRFTLHLENIFHLESPKRIKAVETILDDATLKGKWRAITPRMATREELTLVHTVEHVDRIARTAGKSLASFDLDTQTSEKTYEVAKLAVGAVFSLLDGIIKREAKCGFAFIRPPGHHAEPDKAMGFCIFNNIALGARYLLTQYSVEKVMIIDIDAHHGNGTQTAFYDTDEVLFVSLHQFPCYPGTGNIGEVGRAAGEGFTVNIPVEKGTGDNDFVGIINSVIKPLAYAYQPQIILVSCGFDLYRHDRLTGLNGTSEGYAMITFLLKEIANKVCGGRIAFIMEGGYSVQGIEKCGLCVMQELCDIPAFNRKRLTKKIQNGRHDNLSVIKKVVDVQKKYWKFSDAR